jgi:hypothetical protein
VDLGCGDFSVGRLLQAETYIGVDVVAELVSRNRRENERSGVSFKRLDITEDELPSGDLCLVREVFQHLRPSQVARTLQRMYRYDHCIVSDAQALDIESFVPNSDRPSGAQTSNLMGSGLRLDKPPYNLPAVSVFLEVQIPDEPDMVIRSFYFGRANALEAAKLREVA